jgi:simple sugar transport system ATP-binding protein
VTRAGGPPVAEATGLYKRFGATVALHDVGIRVEPGEVHGLVGRNGAGKSTVVAVLSGLSTPDAGQLRFAGAPAPPLADRVAWRQLVSCVYQRPTIIPSLTVAENLFLNRQSADALRPIRWRALRQEAAGLLASWELAVDVRRPAGELTVEQRQVVEIARALSLGARFIILDEPTARLDAAGIGRLFDRVRALRQRGVTFLFISHHLAEVFDLCDSVTVLRDARQVRTGPVAGLSRDRLVAAMTGTEPTARDDRRPTAPPIAEPVLSVAGRGVTGACWDVSFELRPGELLGLAGAAGSGVFALAESIVGLRRPAGGSVAVAGRPLRPADVPAALAAGIGFVPQDRHREGFVPGLSVAENATMTVPHQLGRHGFLSPRRRARLGRRAIDRLGVVTAGPAQPVADLSGGNQQKVVLARAVADRPRVLVLMAPTAGVDVRSKDALMATAVDAARAGAGVLVVTDDLEDLRYCHRVLVLFRGRQVAELAGSWPDTELVAAMEGVQQTP